jgi:hypothetical protein
MDLEYYVKDDGDSSVVLKRYAVRPQRVIGGAECLFIPHGNPTEYGFKCYMTQKECIKAATRQQRAAKNGLGPDVLSDAKVPVEILVPSKRVKVDLGTLQAIDSWNSKARRFGDEGLAKLWAYKTLVAKRVRVKYNNKEYLDLCQRMNKKGFSSEDLVECNLGRLDGKLICIDFGYLSA